MSNVLIYLICNIFTLINTQGWAFIIWYQTIFGILIERKFILYFLEKIFFFPFLVVLCSVTHLLLAHFHRFTFFSFVFVQFLDPVFVISLFWFLLIWFHLSLYIWLLRFSLNCIFCSKVFPQNLKGCNFPISIVSNELPFHLI